VESWPGSLHVQCNEGFLPLHDACLSEGVTIDIIRYLIDLHPDAIQALDDKMRLPLHMACEGHSGGELEIFETLVEAWPESLQARTIDGRLPLHVACSSENMSDDIILYLIESYPAALQVRDNKMQLPLHLACRCRAQNSDVIDCLVRAWPESVHVSAIFIDFDGDKQNNNDADEQNNNDDEEHKHNIKEGILVLPLDLRVKLSDLLQESGENRLRYLNAELVPILTNGIPPCHFACMHPCTSWYPFRLKTLETLHDFFPHLEEWQRFYDGMLAFHCACRAGAPESFLQWCAQQNPEALVTSTMDMANTPLHCYLLSWTSNQIVLATTTIDTTTTTTTTTIHSNQIHQNMSLSAVQYLVEKHPIALQSSNRQGFLPLHMAGMCDVPLDILFYLAREHPEVCY